MPGVIEQMEQTAVDMKKLAISDTPPTVLRGIKGEVKWFSPYVGYGFITRDDNEKDIFVHFSAIVRSGRFYRFISEGDKVEFDVVQGQKGPEAWSVTAPGGEVIQSSNIFRPRFPRRFGQQAQQKTILRKMGYEAKTKSEKNNNADIAKDAIEKHKDAGGDKLSKGEGRRRLHSRSLQKRMLRKPKRKDSVDEKKEEEDDDDERVVSDDVASPTEAVSVT